MGKMMKNTETHVMRITGGRFSGRRVIIPEGDLEIRPLMDRMRESLFSIIGPLTGLSFLDLFAGSGIAGIEAASRGAEKVDLVELDGAKKDVIEKNISIAQGVSAVRLYIQDVFEFVSKTHNTYDLVYADPPFPLSDKLVIAKDVLKCGLLKDGGRFVIHVPADEASLWGDEISVFSVAGEDSEDSSIAAGGKKCGLGRLRRNDSDDSNIGEIDSLSVRICFRDSDDSNIETDGKNAEVRSDSCEASGVCSSAQGGNRKDGQRKLVQYDKRTYGRNSFLFYRILTKQD